MSENSLTNDKVIDIALCITFYGTQCIILFVLRFKAITRNKQYPIIHKECESNIQK